MTGELTYTPAALSIEATDKRGNRHYFTLSADVMKDVVGAPCADVYDEDLSVPGPDWTPPPTEDTPATGPDWIRQVYEDDSLPYPYTFTQAVEVPDEWVDDTPLDAAEDVPGQIYSAS